MGKLFSVIVPVYNVKDYISKCLDSLIHQGIETDKYEIILINDGSTDGSKEICEKYKDKNKNILLLDQPNQGVSSARNKGLNAANGEYILFVDSDDYLVNDGLKRLARVIELYPKAEVVRFYSSYDKNPKDYVDDSIDYYGTSRLLLERGGYPAFIWTFAYKRSFLSKNNIRFKDLKFSEDGLFIATVYLHNPYIVSTRANIYRYVLRNNSAIGRREIKSSRKYVCDGLTSYELIKEELKTSIFNNNFNVIKACESSMNIKKNSIYSRMLSSEYDFADYKKLMKRIKGNGFFPLVAWSEVKRVEIICKIVNVIFSSFFKYKIASYFFTRIFTPYILPRYRSYVWKKA